MKQQTQRPVRRIEQQRPDQGKEEIWPLSAREFMKLPVAELLSRRNRIRSTRLAPPDQAA